MGEYIKEIRALVGHRPIVYCAGSIIIENEKGQILLGKRTDNHLWGYSGGGIEIGETVEECARRELREEMGLEADELELFRIHSGEEAHMVYPNTDEVYYVEIVYLCRRYHGQIRRQEEELEEIRFFEPTEITLDMISPAIRKVIGDYINERAAKA
ncbi:MAG: NUDIX domain-containing protein [Lachnospiraceae bacterium]|nr:NUDIX domain-containing protein [Lachnospiraceae bacterium]MBQ6106401.1 NUDIX domain-containing protein [Lachnospiraceae bacterium]